MRSYSFIVCVLIMILQRIAMPSMALDELLLAGAVFTAAFEVLRWVFQSDAGQ